MIELINEKRLWIYFNGITTWLYLLFFKETSKMFQEVAPARNSNILFSLLLWELSPPKRITPLPSGDSAITLFFRTYGKDGPVMQKKRIIIIVLWYLILVTFFDIMHFDLF